MESPARAKHRPWQGVRHRSPGRDGTGPRGECGTIPTRGSHPGTGTDTGLPARPARCARLEGSKCCGSRALSRSAAPSAPRPRPVAKEAASPVATRPGRTRRAERRGPVLAAVWARRWMELGEKAGGAARGQLLAGAPQDRAGERQSVPVGRDIIFHFEQDLQEERRALKEDQKMHRNKAMKYLMETNRRRRAFEERQKEEEAKEKRFREQVLQQRKIKFQEATAKFQHAHQSFSRQKQTALIPPVQTKAAFHLEEALEQIKGSVLTPGLCLQNINKINFRTTDDTSSSSVCRSDSFCQKQNSAVFGCDETIQESSRTDMDSHQLLFQKNLEEMQQLLEKQHLNNLENFHQEVKERDDSESLMSLDSLEAGEQNGNCTTQSESSFTTQCDCALYDPEKCQTRKNGLLHTDQSTSKNAHLNNCLRNVDLLHYHNIPTHDLLAKHNVLTPAEHVNTSEEESSASHRSGKQPAEFSLSGGVPVTRQNQVLGNYENIHRGFLECRRQSVVSKIRKPAHHAQNSLCAVQLSPIQSAFDPVQKMKNISKSEEVSESTAQFLVAEKLASTPVAEGEILAAMDRVKPARQLSLLKRALCPSRSTLSIEEQKIFQSLDCLNQKLQNVQKAITRNPFASHVLQISNP
ncbi:centrosomal protein of 126 kDa isoform X2 [Vidua chalybeata]|uniref:centrosomal protein of 126 kDa isoform X2 n=1 Tax=Vidua chalybeata TaxID=81927 RepID=UPI0023A8C5BA|nr:centrosomal protein of 126 kDa isoform X2 [Vidua chalybeata]